MAAGTDHKRVSVDGPFYDQSTFLGRFKHFMVITDPRTALVSDATLDNAKFLLEKYRLGLEPEGTTKDQVLYAKKLYTSAFHPDTGEKQNLIGRMSFQVPGGMAITGCMLQFFRTTPAVVFWQWVNQSFNALVNYTNRNAQSKISTTQLGVAYVSATTSALVTAIGLKSFLQKRASTLLQRFVPFAAVAAANCINIPLMRQSELTDGIAVFDENGNKVTTSRLAAVKGIRIPLDEEGHIPTRTFPGSPGWMLLSVHGANSMRALSSTMFTPCKHTSVLGNTELQAVGEGSWNSQGAGDEARLFQQRIVNKLWAKSLIRQAASSLLCATDREHFTLLFARTILSSS